jgi:hypothetical protein
VRKKLLNDGEIALGDSQALKIYFFIYNDCSYSYVFFKILARGEIEAQGSNI